MSKKAFNKIMAGVEEAIAYAQGETAGSVHTVKGQRAAFLNFLDGAGDNLPIEGDVAPLQKGQGRRSET